MQFSKNFFISLLLLSLWGCKGDQKPLSFPGIVDNDHIEVMADSVQLVPERGMTYYQGKPFTGTVISLYDTDCKSYSIRYLNGKKHGSSQKWFDNGLKSYEANYVNGKEDGIVRTWWRNGNLRTECSFQDGVAHGIQKHWYFSGRLFKIMNLVQGKEQGMQQAWRENGKIYNNYEARNGRIYGLKRSKLCYELDDEKISIGG